MGPDEKPEAGKEPKAGGIAEFIREKTGFNKMKNAPNRRDKQIEDADKIEPATEGTADEPRLSGKNRSEIL
jgi:hypothetical protein